jgi:uncharacterized protein (DUF433 family)
LVSVFRRREHPRKRSGALAFKGTRMPVSTAFENLKAGLSVEEIMQEFSVTREQINAVLLFAAKSFEPSGIVVVLNCGGIETELTAEFVVPGTERNCSCTEGVQVGCKLLPLPPMDLASSQLRL